MKEFILNFRMAAEMASYQPSPEEMQQSLAQWQAWIGNIVQSGNFVSTQQLENGGRVVSQGGSVVTDGPYVELKEMLGGNLVVKAETIDQAVELAKGCPVLQFGGNVEVRPVMNLG